MCQNAFAHILPTFFHARLHLHGGVEHPGHIHEVAVEQVRVHVQRHRGILVAQHPLQRLDVRARMHGQRGGGVPQVVRHRPIVPLPAQTGERVRPPSSLAGEALLADRASTHVAEHALLVFALLAYRFERVHDYAGHGHVTAFMVLRGALGPFGVDVYEVAAHVQYAGVEVDVASLQSGCFAPAQPAEAEQQYERPALLPQLPAVRRFVGEFHQLRYGQVDATILAFGEFRQFDVVARVGGDELVPHGHAAYALHDLVWAVDGWCAGLIDYASDPCLDFRVGYAAYLPFGPFGLAVAFPCAVHVGARCLLPKRLLLGNPLVMQRAYALFATFRVDVAAGGFGYGDVFRRPVLRIHLAPETALVGLRAVRLPIPHTIAGFAFAGLVFRDVSHGSVLPHLRIGNMGDIQDEPKMIGAGLTPTTVANSILRRAFGTGEYVTPMKLQKLLFFVTCLYQRYTGRRLLTESFQPWQYGPVCRSVYDEFKGFGGKPITRYAQDALGKVTAVDESSSPSLRKALNLVWENMGDLSAVKLSRVTHRNNSAWAQAVAERKTFISNRAMANDHTFDNLLGM